jgi:tripartite-type tricarboxylate transporter receptor subunit TctC
MGPGSAAHHFVLRCARGTHLACGAVSAFALVLGRLACPGQKNGQEALRKNTGRRNGMISLPTQHLRAVAIFALIFAGLPSAAPAQTAYPNRTITLVLPFAAGSGTDTTTRIISQHLGAALGVGIVIDNKPGANGMIAATYVARAAPDGYTLFVTTNTTHSANPYLLKTLTYDPVKDFTPVARTGDLPFMLVVNPEVPAKTVAELVAYAKANPGKLTYASGSSSAIVSGATFAHNAGIDMLHVPYKSSPPAMNDVIGGRITMMFTDVLTGLPHVNANALRALAVTTKDRSPLVPNLPSMQEAGVPDFDITSWQGYFGPANLPKEIVTRLNAEIRKIVEKPEIKAQLATLGMDAFSGTPEELGTFVGDQLVLWEKLIRNAGIEKQ